MSIEELQAKLRQLNADANAILTNADENNGGELTEDDITKVEALEVQMKEIEASIEKAEAGQTIRNRIASRGNQLAASAGRIIMPNAGGLEEPVRDPMGGFNNLAEFGYAVRAACPGGSGRIDPRLVQLDPNVNPLAAPANFNQETGSELGYFVPVDLRTEIWELVFQADDLFAEIDSEPTNSNAVEKLKDESTPWGGGGVQAWWRSEGKKMDASKLSLGKSFLELDELYCFVLATDELLEDSPRLAARLGPKAAEAINWKMDEGIIEGTGVGQPLGWRTSSAVVSIAKEGGQGADTIVSQNISKMFARLLRTPGGKPHWRMNQDCLPQVMELDIKNNLIWTPPSSGFVNAPGGFLLGLPIKFSEHNETLGDKFDIELVDPKGYYGVNKAGGPKFDSSIHLFFDYGMQAFRWTFRFGGTPHLSAPIAPKKGTKTRSHFVTLDERA